MRVVILVGGKFHALQLAEQLHQHGYLQRWITSYPYCKLRTKIPKEKIISLPLKEALQVLLNKIALRRMIDTSFLLDALFAWQARYFLVEADILVAWSGYALESFLGVGNSKMLKLLERGSSHCLSQKRIVEEEYRLQGLKPPPVSLRKVKREMEEYDLADYIVVPSSYALDTFLKEGIDKRKLIKIPYGVDATLFRPLPKEDKKFRIIFCGALSLRKGVHYLLDAFCQLNLPASQLWLIGDIDKEFLPLLRRYNRPDIIYKGIKPYHELYRYYSQADLFVLASIEEGFGLVILQAMACGLPVIATVNSGAPDVIREGVDGYILPCRDVNALKEKIIYLYRHRNLAQEMGRNARQRIEENFTWQHYGARVIKSYKELLGRGEGRNG